MRNLTLSFDGKGINHKAAEYSPRLASLSNPNDAFQQQMGHLFAHAPEILQEFRYYVERARRIHERMCSERIATTQEEADKRAKFEKRLKWQESLIAGAEGRTQLVHKEPKGTQRPQRLGA